MVLITNSAEETKIIGMKLASAILKSKKRQERALILKLEGDLGGGKTTFIQGFAKGLGIRQSVLSPTFILMRRYSVNHDRYHNFYHFDCYRLETEADRENLQELGFEKIINSPNNIVAVEWSNKIDISNLPGLNIKFLFENENERKIIIEGSLLSELSQFNNE